MRTPLFQPNSKLFASSPSNLSNPLANALNVLRKDAEGASSLLAHQQLTPNMTVYVQPGRNVAVNGSAIDFAGATSPSFTAPLVGVRTDLLVLNSSGILQILPGISGASNYPQNVRALAEIILTSTTTAITDNLITDVRQFFGASTRPPNTTVTSKLGSESDNPPTNTLFTVLGAGYTPGTNAVTVYIDGVRQRLTIDFTEENSTSIRLVEPAADNDSVVIVCNESSGVDITTRVAKSGDVMSGNLRLPELRVAVDTLRIFRSANKMMFTDIDNPTPLSLSQLASGTGVGIAVNHQEFTASASQTVFNLSFSYVTGSNTLLVYKNGDLLRRVDQYTETTGTQVTMTTPCTLGDKITFHCVSIA